MRFWICGIYSSTTTHTHYNYRMQYSPTQPQSCDNIFQSNIISYTQIFLHVCIYKQYTYIYIHYVVDVYIWSTNEKITNYRGGGGGVATIQQKYYSLKPIIYLSLRGYLHSICIEFFFSQERYHKRHKAYEIKVVIKKHIPYKYAPPHSYRSLGK